MIAKITTLNPQKPKSSHCPLCGSKATPPHTPFCSKRCSQMDLGNWLNEVYVIPAHEADEDADLETLIAQADKNTPII